MSDIYAACLDLTTFVTPEHEVNSNLFQTNHKGNFKAYSKTQKSIILLTLKYRLLKLPTKLQHNF